MTGQGIAIEEQLVHRVVRERVAVIGVRMATPDPEDPLRQQIAQGVVDPRRLPRVHHDRRESIDQPYVSVDSLEQHGPPHRNSHGVGRSATRSARAPHPETAVAVLLSRLTRASPVHIAVVHHSEVRTWGRSCFYPRVNSDELFGLVTLEPP